MSIAILSIDGGGIKGIISAVVLDKLERYIQEYSHNPNARIGEYFDLIAGTSTGSILAGLYLLPDGKKARYSANDILNFYLTMGDDIFNRQLLFPLFGAKYSTKNFKEILKDYFGDIQLSELIKPCLLTSFDTSTRTAAFFNTSSACKDSSRDALLRDVVLASCSAPTYFPPVCLDPPGCDNCYIDGGVIANNPALCALIEAMKLPECMDIKNVHILSVGNVDSCSNYEYCDVKKWGLVEWAIPLFSILLNSNEQTVDYQLSTIFNHIKHPENYVRLELSAEEKVPAMDDVSKHALDYFLNAGEILAHNKQSEIAQFARWLVSR